MVQQTMLTLLLLACASPSAHPPAADAVVADAPAAPPPTSPPQTVREAFPPPDGAARVAGDGFGEWLGTLNLRDPAEPVRTHDGEIVGHKARVVDLPLVKGDLQQCADSAIRLRAQWLVDQGRPVMFHATSGDPLPWSRYSAGEKPVDLGGKIGWVKGGSGTFEGYLTQVFLWAGTLSLPLDTIAVAEPLPGDLLLAPGSPGHVVVLLDVARRGDETLVLVGEGYMPAQDFHVELGPEGGWWVYDHGVVLDHWAMPDRGPRNGGLRRFIEPVVR